MQFHLSRGHVCVEPAQVVDICVRSTQGSQLKRLDCPPETGGSLRYSERENTSGPRTAHSSPNVLDIGTEHCSDHAEMM